MRLISFVTQTMRNYVAHDDPLVYAANLVAMVIAWNQPFYPLYVWWLVSDTIWPTSVTFLSTPFFLAVPVVSKRSPVAGRMLLVLTGLANTVLCAKAFGTASGVELFFAPCAMLAGMLFRPRERWIMLGLLGLTFVAFFLRDRYGAPLHLYSALEYQHFFSLHAGSVGTLMVFLGIVLSNAIARCETKT